MEGNVKLPPSSGDGCLTPLINAALLSDDEAKHSPGMCEKRLSIARKNLECTLEFNACVEDQCRPSVDMSSICELQNKNAELIKEKNEMNVELQQQRESLSKLRRDTDFKIFNLECDLEEKAMEIVNLKRVKADLEWREQLSARKLQDLSNLQSPESVPEESVAEEREERVDLLEMLLKTLEEKQQEQEKDIIILREELSMTKDLLQIQTDRAYQFDALNTELLSEFENVSSEICNIAEDLKDWKSFKLDLTNFEEPFYEDLIMCVKNVLHTFGKGPSVLKNMEMWGVEALIDEIFKKDEEINEQSLLLQKYEADLCELQKKNDEFTVKSKVMKTMNFSNTNEVSGCNKSIGSQLDGFTAKCEEAEDFPTINVQLPLKPILDVNALTEDQLHVLNAIKTNISTNECANSMIDESLHVDVLTEDKLKEEAYWERTVDMSHFKAEIVEDPISGMASFASVNSSLIDNKSSHVVLTNDCKDLDAFAKDFSEYLVNNQVFHPDVIPPKDSNVFHFLLDCYLELVTSYYAVEDKIKALEEESEQTRNETTLRLSRLENQLDSSAASSFDFEKEIQSSTFCDARPEITFTDTVVDELTHDPLQITNDSSSLLISRIHIEPPITPLQRPILKREACSSIKKTVKFESPIIIQKKNLLSENKILKEQLNEKESKCSDLLNAIEEQKSEIGRLLKVIDDLEIRTRNNIEIDLEREQKMLKLEKELEEILTINSQLREKLVQEVVELDPLLGDQLDSSSSMQILSLFMETIIRRFESLHMSEKENFSKEVGEKEIEKLHLCTKNQALEESLRQMKFDLGNISATLELVTQQKMALEEKICCLDSQLTLLKQEKDDSLVKYEESAAKVEELTTELAEKVEEIEKCKEKLNSLTTECYEQTRSKEVEYEKLLEDKTTMENKLTSLESVTAEKITAVMNEMEVLINEKNEIIRGAEVDIIALKEEREALKYTINELQSKLEPLKAKSAEITIIESSLEAMERENTDLSNKLCLLEEERKKLLLEKEELLELSNKRKEEVASFELEKECLSSELLKLTTSLAAKGQEIVELKQSQETIRNELNTLNSDKCNLVQEVEDLKKRSCTLTLEKENLVQEHENRIIELTHSLQKLEGELKEQGLAMTAIQEANEVLVKELEFLKESGLMEKEDMLSAHKKALLELLCEKENLESELSRFKEIAEGNGCLLMELKEKENTHNSEKEELLSSHKKTVSELVFEIEKLEADLMCKEIDLECIKGENNILQEKVVDFEEVARTHTAEKQDTLEAHNRTVSELFSQIELLETDLKWKETDFECIKEDNKKLLEEIRAFEEVVHIHVAERQDSLDAHNRTVHQLLNENETLDRIICHLHSAIMSNDSNKTKYLKDQYLESENILQTESDLVVTENIYDKYLSKSNEVLLKFENLNARLQKFEDEVSSLKVEEREARLAHSRSVLQLLSEIDQLEEEVSLRYKDLHAMLQELKEEVECNKKEATDATVSHGRSVVQLLSEIYHIEEEVILLKSTILGDETSSEMSKFVNEIQNLKLQAAQCKVELDEAMILKVALEKELESCLKEKEEYLVKYNFALEENRVLEQEKKEMTVAHSRAVLQLISENERLEKDLSHFFCAVKNSSDSIYNVFEAVDEIKRIKERSVCCEEQFKELETRLGVIETLEKQKSELEEFVKELNGIICDMTENLKMIEAEKCALQQELNALKCAFEKMENDSSNNANAAKENNELSESLARLEAENQAILNEKSAQDELIKEKDVLIEKLQEEKNANIDMVSKSEERLATALKEQIQVSYDLTTLNSKNVELQGTAELLRKEIDRLNDIISEISDWKSRVEAERNLFQDENKLLKSALEEKSKLLTLLTEKEELINKLEAEKRVTVDDIEKQLAIVIREKAASCEEVSTLELKCMNYKEEMLKLEGEIKQLKDDLLKLEEKTSKEDDTANKLSQEVKNLETVIADKDKLLESYEIQLKTITVEKEKIGSNLQQREKDILNMETAIKNHIDEIKTLQESVADANDLREEILIVKENIKELHKEIASYEADIEVAKTEKNRLNTELSNLEKDLNDKSESLAKCQNELEKVRIEKEDVQQSLGEEIKETTSKFEAITKNLLAELEKSKASENELKEELAALKLCLDNSDKELDSAKNEKSQLELCLSEMKEKLATTEAMLSTYEEKNKSFCSELEILRKELYSNKNAIHTLTDNTDKVATSRDYFKSKCERLQAELRDSELRRFELDELLKSYKNTEAVILRKLEEKQKSDEANLKLAQQIQELHEEIKVLKDCTEKQAGLRIRIKELSELVGILESDVEEKNRLAEAAESKVQSYIKEKASLESVVSKLTKENDELNEGLRHKNVIAVQKSLENDVIKQQVSDLEKQIALKEQENLEVRRNLCEKDGVVTELNLKVNTLNENNAEMLSLLKEIQLKLGLPEDALMNLSKKENGRSYLKFFMDHSNEAKEVLNDLRQENKVMKDEKERLKVEIEKLTSEKLQFEIKGDELIAFGRSQEGQIASLSRKLAALEAGLGDRKGCRSDISSRRMEKLEELNKSLNDLFIQLLTHLRFAEAHKVNLYSLRGLESVSKKILDYADKLAENENAVETLKSRIEELDAENQELSDNVEHLLKLNNDLELKVLQIPKNVVASSDCSECAKLQKALKNRNEEITKLKALRDDNQQNIVRLNDDVTRLKEKMEELDAENQELSDNVEHLLKLNNDLELKLLQLPKKGAASSDCRECFKLQKAVENRNEEIAELKALRDDNQRSIVRLNEDVKRLKEKLKALEGSCEELRLTLKDKEEELLRTVSNIQHSSELRKVEGVEGKDERLQEQNRVLSKRNDVYRECLRQKNEEIRELKAKITKGAMNSNCLDSPIREHRYNLRGKQEPTLDGKRAFRRKVEGIENM